jgi:hypothetical protein
MTCIAEPISWLRLEQYALASAHDLDIDVHLAQCEACRSALNSIRADQFELPALAAEPHAKIHSLDEARQRGHRRRWIAVATIAPTIAIAAGLMLWLRSEHAGHDNASLPTFTTVKGAGEVSLVLARNRGGNVQTNVATFRAGDSWKLLLTCAATPTVSMWADVAVFDVADNGSATPSFPLQASRIECGNSVALPGAFEITGNRNNLVCVVLSVDAATDRNSVTPHSQSTICTTVNPE